MPKEGSNPRGLHKQQRNKYHCLPHVFSGKLIARLSGLPWTGDIHASCSPHVHSQKFCFFDVSKSYGKGLFSLSTCGECKIPLRSLKLQDYHVHSHQNWASTILLMEESKRSLGKRFYASNPLIVRRRRKKKKKRKRKRKSANTKNRI